MVPVFWLPIPIEIQGTMIGMNPKLVRAEGLRGYMLQSPWLESWRTGPAARFP